MNPEKINFVIVELCDNDFGSMLKDALRDLLDNSALAICPIIAKRYIIEYLIGRIKLRDILDNKETNEIHYRNYFSRIRVRFENNLNKNPLPDHDGGSVYYDVNMDMVFTF